MAASRPSPHGLAFADEAHEGDGLLLRPVEGGRTVLVDFHDPAQTPPPGGAR